MSVRTGSNRWAPRADDIVGISGWIHDHPLVYLLDSGDHVVIGANALVGAEKLRVVGSIRMDDAAGQLAFLEGAAGDNSPVSNANEGRIRYNVVLQRWECSENGGAYVPMATPGSNAWTRVGTVVSLTNIGDTVAIGAGAMVGTEKLLVVGALAFDNTGAASTGKIRLGDGDEITAWVGAITQALIGSVGTNENIGGPYTTRPNIIFYDAITSHQIYVNGNPTLAVLSALIRPYVNIEFDAGAVSPVVFMATDSTPGGTGDDVTYAGQSMSDPAGAAHAGHTGIRGGQGLVHAGNTDGNVWLHASPGAYATWNSAEKILFIGNCVTVASAALANGVALYANSGVLTSHAPMRAVGSLTLDDAVSKLAFIASYQGSLAAVSLANSGRIRYNEVSQKWEFSENTGAYTSFTSIGSIIWTRTGTVISPTVNTDSVAFGAAASASGTVRLTDTNNITWLNGGVDYALVSGQGTVALLGGAYPTRPTSANIDAGTTARLQVGGVSKLTTTSTTITFVPPDVSFTAASVAPSITQVVDANAGVTADDLGVFAQSVSDPAGAAHAGNLGLRGGQGTVHVNNTDGNVWFHTSPGAYATWQSAEKIIFIGDCVTAPSAPLANGAALYSSSATLSTNAPLMVGAAATLPTTGDIGLPSNFTMVVKSTTGEAVFLAVDAGDDTHLGSDDADLDDLYLDVATGQSVFTRIASTRTFIVSESVTEAGAGTRCFFAKTKGAFRAGLVTGTQWDDANIGTGSVALGTNCRSSNTNAFSVGDGLVSSGASSTSFGSSGISSGSYTISGGYCAVAAMRSQLAMAGSCFSANADAQRSNLSLMRASTDAGAVELTLEGSAPGAGTRLTIASGKLYKFRIELSCICTAGTNIGQVATWEIKGVIKNIGGTTTLVSTNSSFDGDAGLAAATAVVTADDANDCLVCTCTGIVGAAANTFHWHGGVYLSEVA